MFLEVNISKFQLLNNDDLYQNLHLILMHENIIACLKPKPYKTEIIFLQRA